MRVTRARIWAFRVPFLRPYVTAHGRAVVREGALVSLTLESGQTGLGEASLLPDEKCDASELVAACREICRHRVTMVAVLCPHVTP